LTPIDELRPPHFLLWRFEAESICSALRVLAAECGAESLGDATICTLRDAHRDAERRHAGKTVFRFQAPAGAEHLVAAATIRVRRNARAALRQSPDPRPRRPDWCA
jgi:hypothetical protein